MSTVPLHRRTTPVVPIRPAPALLATADLSGAYFPGWGLFFSILIHACVVVSIFYFSVSLEPLRLALPPRWPNLTNQLEMRVVMFLPLHGGGDQSPGMKGGAMEARRAGPSLARAAGSKGMTYPGPQPIVSDLPKPTNRIQTILQPKLLNPTILTPPVPLPNIIQMTEAGPDPQLLQPQTKPSAPIVVQAPEPAPTVAASRLVLPAAVSPMLLPRIASRTVEIASAPAVDLSHLFDPDPQPAVQPEAEPLPETSGNVQARRLQEFAPVPTHGNDPRNLLVLTPLPALPDSAVIVPPGEARGRFAISPEPEPAATETEPGTKGGTPSSAVGLGTQPGTSTGNTVPVVTITFGPSVGPGTGAGSAGKGTGTDAARGSGTGTGPGTGTGSGAGAGSGPGKGAFSGITIVGGVGGTGTSGNSSPPPAKPAPRPLQTTYGLYVVSTEDGGGGLPFYGVFSHEQVYTVYLDMRKTETDVAPNWTLEFAVLQGTAAQVNPPENPTEAHQGIVLPFPTSKELPAWPAEVVRQHLGKLIVVYGVINAEGKMERLSVKGSPDWQLNDPVLKALEKWTFRPAVLNGTPVSVKLLLGIPLWLPE